MSTTVTGSPPSGRQRIGEVTMAVATARAAYEDAAAAWQRAAAKIAVGALPAPPPGPADLTVRLVDLDALLTAGHWSRLAAELDEIEQELARTSASYRLTPDETRRIELVDLANAIRPRTPT
jgi:hypothetical protein